MNEKELIQLCLQGNRNSLEELVNQVQGQIFNLCLRFYWNRPDAEDATQEILIKLITNLGKFDSRSKFNTWAYRVSVNYLLNARKTSLEKTFSSFQVFSDDLKQGIDMPVYDFPDQPLLEKEVKTGCTLAMLQCLNRELRIAFILGTVFKIRSKEAAIILEISPENFRKRLELSKKLIAAFLNSHCGVYNPYNSCRCLKRISFAVSTNRVKKNDLSFASNIDKLNGEMEELHSISGIYLNHGNISSRSDFNKELLELIRSKNIYLGFN
jgi:RNA polymerase sigma factor (sigma-70 family)